MNQSLGIGKQPFFDNQVMQKISAPLGAGGTPRGEYAEDFRKAIRLLTKDVTLDFKVALSLYYLEHDPDLHVTFDRQELAV